MLIFIFSCYLLVFIQIYIIVHSFRSDYSYYSLLFSRDKTSPNNQADLLEMRWDYTVRIFLSSIKLVNFVCARYVLTICLRWPSYRPKKWEKGLKFHKSDILKVLEMLDTWTFWKDIWSSNLPHCIPRSCAHTISKDWGISFSLYIFFWFGVQGRWRAMHGISVTNQH